MIKAVAPQNGSEATSQEQLTLLPSPATNPRFALSESTRKRGLRHVAEIRLHLAARSSAQVGQIGIGTTDHDIAA